MKDLKKLLKIFWIFFKIGTFTFGGGLTMLPLIQKEVVDKQKWIEEEEILDVFAICQSVPGVIAINSAIFVGNKVRGVSGAIAATLGVVLPAFISIILILVALTGIRNNIYVEKVFGGIRAAATALILLSAIKLGKGALKSNWQYVVAVLSFLIIVILNISAVWAVVLGGATGYIIYIFGRRRK
ncbi:chromate transporter [Clostridium sp. DJ247]|uniref:chromate transporter n=1 Tax=Clostridium sp. DJ247 TaxID=2726188 RepID=UPI001623A2B2|nr:chromate transporter [Clostridium sp. DJ247]MBC2581484.1 chromate transporter [Clostridium sp. DJ247]